MKKTLVLLSILVVPFGCSISDKEKIPPGTNVNNFPPGVVEYRNTWPGKTWAIDTFVNGKGQLILSFVCSVDSPKQMKNWDSLNSVVLERKNILEALIMRKAVSYYGCMFHVTYKDSLSFSAGYVFDRKERRELMAEEKADLFFHSIGIEQIFYIDRQKGYGRFLIALPNKKFTEDSIRKFSEKIMPFVHVVLAGNDTLVNRYGFEYRYGQFQYPDKWQENMYARKKEYRFTLYIKDLPSMYKID